MPQTAELSEVAQLHRALDQLRRSVGAVRIRYGDIPAVRHLVGHVDRMEMDASEFDSIPAPAGPRLEPVEVLTDEPFDPSLWADADDEGVGGYHGGAAQ